MTKTRKARAFELFDAGYGVSSPEIKRLQLKGSTKYNYYLEWKKSRGVTDSTEEGKAGGKLRKVGNTPLPKGESIAGLKDVETPDKVKSVEPPSPAAGEAEQPASDEPEELWLEDKLTDEEMQGLERVIEERRAADKLPPEGTEPPDGTELPAGDGKEEPKNRPRAGIIGEGLLVQVRISVKTLALYEFAHNLQTEEMSLGDFIDACVEDVYRGRGKDLGIISLKGEE